MSSPSNCLVDTDRVAAALRQSWSLRTSTKWQRSNPAAGQCSVTALVLQDHFGGILRKTRVADAWHFYNEIAGRMYDFTAEQFREHIEYCDQLATREEAFADTSPEQYEELRVAFARIWNS